MAKYRFRLETLRKLRIARRDESRTKLAEAYQAVQLLEEQQEAIDEEILALQESQRRSASAAVTDVNSLLESQRYQSVLRAQQGTLQDQAKLLAEEVERRRQSVVEADRQVRVLDKLDERGFHQHQQHAMRTEMKALDEIASRRREVNQTWQD